MKTYNIKDNKNSINASINQFFEDACQTILNGGLEAEACIQAFQDMGIDNPAEPLLSAAA